MRRGSALPGPRPHRRTRGRAVWLLIPFSLSAASPTWAVELEKLVMPGPVIAGHADLEGRCRECHQAFQPTEERTLCLACHEEVEADLTSRTGFHGLAPSAAQSDCRSCHTEHKGRDADIVGLDEETFDHRFADFHLEGAHARAPCAACHESEAKHREAPLGCVECHREDDAHGGELGENCGECHDVETWSKGSFDHAKTGFPLQGRHESAVCALCHPAERYENTASDCRSCHALDDAHVGRFGGKCGDCHTSFGWKKTRFDHARDTDFPLRGSHQRADCTSCHTGNLYLQELDTSCISCHRADDEHRGRNGEDCERCHSESRWTSSTFDHERDTEFPLRGSHKNVKCESCHTSGLVEQEIARDCYSCHRADDVHRGQQGEGCETCHNETGWDARVRFDHDLTSFPLLGLHAVAACEQCHVSSRFKEAPLACRECHDDSFHRGRLGSDCSVCHNPNAWRVWSFDHDQQTRFALHGAHAELDCHGCHRAPVEHHPKLSRQCWSCHSRDDSHGGAYGRDCARCHNDRSWLDVERLQ